MVDRKAGGLFLLHVLQDNVVKTLDPVGPRGHVENNEEGDDAKGDGGDGTNPNRVYKLPTLSYTHVVEKREILRRYGQKFPFWHTLLWNGYNLLLHGLGSKRKLLNKFAVHELSKPNIPAVRSSYSSRDEENHDPTYASSSSGSDDDASDGEIEADADKKSSKVRPKIRTASKTKPKTEAKSKLPKLKSNFPRSKNALTLDDTPKSNSIPVEILVFDGYNPATTALQVAASVLKALRGEGPKPSESLRQVIAAAAVAAAAASNPEATGEKRTKDIYVVIHNIEGPGLRRDLGILSHLFSFQRSSNQSFRTSDISLGTCSAANVASSLSSHRSPYDTQSKDALFPSISANTPSASPFSATLLTPNASIVRLVASADHILTRRLWDQSAESRFRWLYIHAPTFLPYNSEISSRKHPSILAAALSASVGEAGRGNENEESLSATTVLRSLVLATQEVFRVLAEYLISQQNADGGNQSGIFFAQLYKMCRDRFLVSNDALLRQMLVELVDHNLVAVANTGNGEGGGELLYIPQPPGHIISMLQDLDRFREEEHRGI
mmetsp:Transcript_27092/g.49929  ORF Transcript_27092/g.49929 Transcript_27092/m.49929 type:complete len:552 (-) Transcript_27092:159-1814(-)